MTPQQGENKLSLIFRDEILNEDVRPDDKYSMYDMMPPDPKPQLVAVIYAALMASGLVGGRAVVTSVRPAGKPAPWKMAGLMELMAARELNRY